MSIFGVSIFESKHEQRRMTIILCGIKKTVVLLKRFSGYSVYATFGNEDGGYIKWFTLYLFLRLHWGTGHVSTTLGQVESRVRTVCGSFGGRRQTAKASFTFALAGPGVREIFKTYPDEVKGDAKEFDKAMTCLSNHFEVKKNVPLARQKLLASKPNPGETINYFVTRLELLAEHCNYEEEDNQVRYIVIFHVTNKELKSKFYREEIFFF